ncbi:hypothetical protein OJF2_11430 [Aquisphaera giovannonii]|uniref:LamG-like jellyroll fold domain-containing protein n=1 Tax=Aquisphaera giovannonii TaxID=406548 RepID=A0A5B9VX51_9BACT|nr:hypothetical protein [Aquisphaera giovannonii]QEH32664.1 hypothetical protein OJF2_11430 [Aquisphaera giovannonii]
MRTSPIVSSCGVLALSLAAFAPAADAGLVVSVEAPGVQATSVAGAVTETFDSFSSGGYQTLNTALGTVTTTPTGNFAAIEASPVGGAGGSGNFFVLGYQSGSAEPATLTLSQPQSYFGFWWSAADGSNEIAFYSNGQWLGSFRVFATAGTSITSVVFSNSGTTLSGFETDNWSVSATAHDAIPGRIIEGAIASDPSRPRSRSAPWRACSRPSGDPPAGDPPDASPGLGSSSMHGRPADEGTEGPSAAARGVAARPPGARARPSAIAPA